MVVSNGHDGIVGCQHGVLGGSGRTEAEAAEGDVQRWEASGYTGGRQGKAWLAGYSAGRIRTAAVFARVSET